MKKITIITLLALVFCGTGCSNFLTQEPILSQSTDLTMASFKGLNSAALGLYSPIAGSNWYGANYILDAEMRSGNGKLADYGGYGSGRAQTPYNLNYSSTVTSSVWGTGYYVIGAANNIIENLTNKQSTEVSEQQIKNINAEALFIRALAHFDIVRLFAQPYSKDPNGIGIPIVIKTDPNAQPARSTIAEVYNQIVTDLTNAEALMSDDYSRKGDVADVKAAVSNQQFKLFFQGYI